MASGITTAFWAMTINNYDDTDLAMVQNGYPDYMREIVHTLERGKDGTSHIQAYIKLQRQQRLSFVKKLFPRGHFTPLTSDVYILNTKKYAQKLDDTAMAAAVHKFNDPTHTLESVIKRMCIKIREDEQLMEQPDLDVCKIYIEKQMVKEDYRYAKIFVSSTYSQMWKKFGYEMFENIINTHTHTHKDKIFYQEVDIPTTNETREAPTRNCASQEADWTEEDEGSDFEDSECSSDEGYIQGSSVESGEEDD